MLGENIHHIKRIFPLIDKKEEQIFEKPNIEIEKYLKNQKYWDRELKTPASPQLLGQPAPLGGKVFAPAEKVGKSEEKVFRIKLDTWWHKKLYLSYGGVVRL